MINSSQFDKEQSKNQWRSRYPSVDQTHIKQRLDNLLTSKYERNVQSAEKQSFNDLLSSQKMRWAKKGSQKVSYMEDSSYNYVHNDIINTSYQMKQIDDVDEQIIQEEIENKKQIWSNNFIKILMKQKEKQLKDSYSEQFFQLLNQKVQNEKNLSKLNDPPKYKLYQTSIQKRNLPPVKLKQLKYLQYFEEKKQQFPHLHQPLNEIVLPSPYEIIPDMCKTQRNNDKEQQNQIRNHIYQQAQAAYQQEQKKQFKNDDVKSDESELTYIKKAIENLEKNYSPSKFLVEKSSYKQIQNDILNQSPTRKQPRIYGSRNPSPLCNQNQKTPPKQSKRLNKKTPLEHLQLDDIDKNNNFYTHSVSHLDQSYQFSLKSSQITPLSKKHPINFYDIHNNKMSQSSEQSPPYKNKYYSNTTTNNTNNQKKFDFLVTSKLQSQVNNLQNYSFHNDKRFDQKSIFISR